MSSVFQVGDVVYHVAHGEGKVVEVGGQCQVQYTSSPYPYWSNEVSLSFTPWPKPNHVRPFKEEWWLIRYNDGSYGVKWRISEHNFQNRPGPGIRYFQTIGEAVKPLGTEL